MGQYRPRIVRSRARGSILSLEKTPSADALALTPRRPLIPCSHPECIVGRWIESPFAISLIDQLEQIHPHRRANAQREKKHTTSRGAYRRHVDDSDTRKRRSTGLCLESSIANSIAVPAWCMLATGCHRRFHLACQSKTWTPG